MINLEFAGGSKIALKPVMVEKFSGNEVLVRGIIVTAGVHKLRAGMTVRISEAAQ